MPGHRSNLAYKYDPNTLSPRVKLAIRLYGSGAVRTMSEASVAAGMSKQGLYFRKHQDRRMDIYLHQLEKQIHDGTVDMSQVLQRLGRQAIVNIAHLGTVAQKEDVRLRANQDLADRSPETAKTHKVKLEEDIHITPKAIENLQKALLESAASRAQFVQVISGDYVTVDEESSTRHMKQLPAPSNASSNGSGPSVP